MRAILSILISTLFTFSVYVFELKNARTNSAESTLQFARSTVLQLENTFKYAKESHKSEPLSWALTFLASPTGWTITPISPQGTELSNPGDEKYHLSFSNQLFEYSKIFTTDGKVGVHLQRKYDYLGFLGVRNRELSYGIAGIIFLFVFLICYQVRFESNIGSIDMAKKASSSSLIGLARCVRNLIQEIQLILSATMKSIEIVNSIYFRSIWLRDTVFELEERLKREKINSADVDKILTRLNGLIDAQFESGLSVHQKHQEILKVNSRMNLALSDVKEALKAGIEAEKLRTK